MMCGVSAHRFRFETYLRRGALHYEGGRMDAKAEIIARIAIPPIGELRFRDAFEILLS